jgi:hypothetical protein
VPDEHAPAPPRGACDTPERRSDSAGRSAAASPRRCTCLTATERLQGPSMTRKGPELDNRQMTTAG